MSRFIDITGQKFGRLTVISRCENINGRIAWNCLCDCGNEIKVISKSLRNENTKSCGCLHKEIVSKQFSKDITGQRFGKLVVIESTKRRNHGSIVYKCLCDCGNIHYVSAEVLLAGHCSSCGCIHSKGNAKIHDILQNHHISFVPEYSIRINNINYYFDFAIFDLNNNITNIIEYDGILHFEYDKNHGWNNEENWEKTHQNDLIKDQWCFDNNVPILRIPYIDYEKINYDYLKERIENI